MLRKSWRVPGMGIGVRGRVSEFVGGYRNTGGGYLSVLPKVWCSSETFISCSPNVLLHVSDCGWLGRLVSVPPLATLRVCSTYSCCVVVVRTARSAGILYQTSLQTGGEVERLEELCCCRMCWFSGKERREWMITRFFVKISLPGLR